MSEAQMQSGVPVITWDKANDRWVVKVAGEFIAVFWRDQLDLAKQCRAEVDITPAEEIADLKQKYSELRGPRNGRREVSADHAGEHRQVGVDQLIAQAHRADTLAYDALVIANQSRTLADQKEEEARERKHEAIQAWNQVAQALEGIANSSPLSGFYSSSFTHINGK